MNQRIAQKTVKGTLPHYVTLETWESLFRLWHDKSNMLDWNCVFTLPVWLKAWWDTFGKGPEAYICAVWKDRQLIGIAPFIRDGETVRIIGSPDVSDYADFIVSKGQEHPFLRILFTHLRSEGISSVRPGQIRPDSSVFSELKKKTKDLGCKVILDPAERTYELHLPHTWDEYLRMLSGKERHEILRKLRRLNNAGQITYRVVQEVQDIKHAMDIFIRLFRSSRPDKAGFMDQARESFFRVLAVALSEAGILRLLFLDINNKPAAVTMCFDYRSAVYIYNNGYNEIYRSLSVGVLSKIFSIRHSIELGRKKYDLLKGDEPYKKRLGGVPVQLYDCSIELT